MIPLLLAFWFAPQEKPIEKATFSGVVVDSVTGRPLSKVTVMAKSAKETVSTASDGEGHFELVDLEPGQYRLWGQRNGYLQTYFGAKRPDTEGPAIPLERGQHATDFQLKLIPLAVISGTIRDADGEPLSGADVFLMAVEYSEGRRRYSDAGSKETDDLGQFRLQVRPGLYYVRVDPSDRYEHQNDVDHSPKASKRPEMLLAALYPGTPDISSARILQVDAGARLEGMDMSLPRSAVYRVSVHVDGPAGLETGAYLRHSGDGTLGNYGFAGQRKAHGDFEFHNVPPGSYTLVARARPPSGPFTGVMDVEDRGYTISMPVNVVSRDVEGLRLTIEPGAEVSGHLAAEEENPPEFVGAHISFQSDSGSFGTYVKHGDSFGASLSPGHYQVFVQHETKVKSIRFEDKDVLADGLTIAGPGPMRLEIVMSADGGKVDGVVTDQDDKPAAGATVLLVPEEKRRHRWDLFLTATADQFGRYELKNVSPGEYKLFAWDDVLPGLWFEPDFLKNVEKYGKAVTVEAKGHATSQIRIAPGTGN